MAGIFVFLNFPVSNENKTDLSQETEKINKNKAEAEPIKELSAEEIKQAAIQLMAEAEKNNPSGFVNAEEKEEAIKSAIQLMEEAEKNNPN